MKKGLLLLISHSIFAFIGFALGIYSLPILTASKPPSQSEMAEATAQTEFKGVFKKDLAGSDFLHWGEGTLSVGKRFISLEGKLAPGPDYKLYLSPDFVETESEFNQLKSKMINVGEIKTFNGFVLPVDEKVDLSHYTTAIIWCESFGEFITAAKYR